MEAFILPISFKPESIEGISPSGTPEEAGKFEEILQNRSLGPRDRAGEAAEGSVNKRDCKPARMGGSRNIRQRHGKSDEPHHPGPVHQPMPKDEMSPGILQMAKLLSGAGESGLTKEMEAAFPRELDFQSPGILPPDSDSDAHSASQPMETGKGLANRRAISIPAPLIFSRPMDGQSSFQRSPALMKDAQSSLIPQDAGKAAGTRSGELPPWIETMKSSGPADLSKIHQVRSQTSQGTARIEKDLQEGGKGKTILLSGLPAAKTTGQEEAFGMLKLNWGNPPSTAQNQEQEDAPLLEKVVGRSPDQPASSLNPAGQAYSSQEKQPGDSLLDARFSSGQMEWIHREGTSFQPESMGGGKPESGETKIFVGVMEGSAASLNGPGNRIEGAQGLPPAVMRPEILNLPEQVVQRIIWSIRNQEERIKLTLDPPDLGHLYIEISRSKENIHATLWAENFAAKTALETGQHQIQRIMENEGFRLTKFDVFVQQDMGWFQGQGKRENHFVLDSRTPMPSLEQKGEVLEKSPLDPIEIRGMATGRSSLDLWV